MMTMFKCKRSIYNGHLVLLSTFTLNFVAIGSFNSAGLYISPLSDTFPQYGSGTLALYCTVQIVAGLISSLVGGIAQDALQSRGVGVQWLFFSGGAFMSLGFLHSSVSSTLFGVLSGSVLTGIGLGLAGLMAGGIAVLWFEAARGKMLLLAMCGQGTGNVFFAYTISRLLEINDGSAEDPWRPTMRWMGLISFVLCAIASTSMRMPLWGEVEEYEKGINESSIQNGLLIMGDTSYGSLEPTSIKEVESSQRNAHTQRRRSGADVLDHLRSDYEFSRQLSITSHDTLGSSTRLGYFQAVSNASPLTPSDFTATDRNDEMLSTLGEIRDVYDYSLKEISSSRTAVCLNLFMIIACFAKLNMQVLLPHYVQSVKISSSGGGHAALMMIGVGDFLSNLTLGAAADRIGARRLLTLAFSVLSILYFIWPNCTTIKSLAAVAFLYGYFCCTINSMPIIILADAFSESSSEHILALNGIANMSKFPGYLFGPFLAGHLVEHSGGSYETAAIFSGVASLGGALMLLMIPPPEEQQRLLKERWKNNLSDGNMDSWMSE